MSKSKNSGLNKVCLNIFRISCWGNSLDFLSQWVKTLLPQWGIEVKSLTIQVNVITTRSPKHRYIFPKRPSLYSMNSVKKFSVAVRGIQSGVSVVNHQVTDLY